MGRLIDAGLVLANLSGRLESMKDYDAVKDVINNMPTAYDVDKVLEQLRKMNPNAECFEDMNDYGEALHLYNDIIEIVYAGGVDKPNKLTLEQQIEFCGNKIENIKLKTGPETFVAIQESLKELQKLKQIEKAEYSE